MKTIREIETMYGITRRMIQNYEKRGLVHYTTKNKYGYLLYDEKMIERMKWIRFFQNAGFILHEIEEIVDASHEEICQRLKERLEILYQQRQDLDLLISQIQAYISD